MSAKTFTILLIVIVSMFVFGVIKCFAEEAEQSVNDNRAVVALQKQPSNKVQKQEAKQNKWCIIVQINGKRERAESVVQSTNSFSASQARQVKDTSDSDKK